MPLLAIANVIWPGALIVLIILAIIGCVIKWAGFSASVNKMFMVVGVGTLVVWIVLIILWLVGVVNF